MSVSLKSLRASAAGAILLLLAAGCATSPSGPAPRERFPLDPREELTGPFPESVDSGWAALSKGNAKSAQREFERDLKAGRPLASEIGWIEAAVLAGQFEDATGACRDALASGEPTVPLLVACGEANGRGGKPVEGYRLYRRAVTRPAGSRAGLKSRAEELRIAGRDAMAAEARVASEEKRWAEARDRIAVAIDVAPEEPGLRALAGEIEEAAGELDQASRRYREALDMDPKNAAIAERVGELAMQRKDYSLAVSVFDALAKNDPSRASRAEEARLAFRVSNWPAPERAAAAGPHLTRASAAALVWWMFPEVREARVSSSVIASDAVSRRDARAFARVVALGLLEVDRETHRGNPDGTLTRTTAARLLVRLMGLMRSEGFPCLGKTGLRPSRAGSDAVRSAEACGLWGEGEAGPPSGPEFTRALDRVRALAAVPGEESEHE